VTIAVIISLVLLVAIIATCDLTQRATL
jgi:hypothetical protein